MRSLQLKFGGVVPRKLEQTSGRIPVAYLGDLGAVDHRQRFGGMTPAASIIVAGLVDLVLQG